MSNKTRKPMSLPLPEDEDPEEAITDVLGVIGFCRLVDDGGEFGGIGG